MSLNKTFHSFLHIGDNICHIFTVRSSLPWFKYVTKAGYKRKLFCFEHESEPCSCNCVLKREHGHRMLFSNMLLITIYKKIGKKENKLMVKFPAGPFQTIYHHTLMISGYHTFMISGYHTFMISMYHHIFMIPVYHAFKIPVYHHTFMIPIYYYTCLKNPVCVIYFHSGLDIILNTDRA